jgi:hypothetical protein
LSRRDFVASNWPNSIISRIDAGFVLGVSGL